MADFTEHVQAFSFDSENEFKMPQCFVNLSADAHCITYIAALVFKAVICLLFVYQIVLWIDVYRYSFRDQRIHVMTACALYLLLDIIASFGTLSSMAYAEAILSMFHYQIFASTFLHYYRKVMKILPQLKVKWNLRLISMHILISFALCVLLAIIFIDLANMDLAIVLTCGALSYVVFQIIVALSFLVYLALHIRIVLMLNRFKRLSSLDKLIWRQHQRKLK